MATLTIRLPDDQHDRLKQLAKRQKISINKLMERLSTIALTAFDVESQFRLQAARGNAKRGLALLDKVDAQFANHPAPSKKK
jgi:predicted transcriptional regulator